MQSSQPPESVLRDEPAAHSPDGVDISIVLVDGSFRERFHILDSLANQTMASSRFEVIWVEYFDELRPTLAAKVDSIENARALCLGMGGTYHSSHCFNVGITQATGELVVIPDADLLVKPRFLDDLWVAHRTATDLVTYCYRVNERPPAVWRPDLPPPTIESIEASGEITHPSNWGGCLAVRRRWLLALNGYEMHPVFESGDHGNDFDMYVRLKNLGLAVRWLREPLLYHPWHPGTLRWSESHRRQACVTQFRARTLQALAFHGIDESRNAEMPPALLDELDGGHGAGDESGTEHAPCEPPVGRFGP